MRLSKRQTEELAKFCLDISKLALGSWIFGLFSSSKIELVQLLFGFAGLTFAILFFKLGIELFKEIK